MTLLPLKRERIFEKVASKILEYIKEKELPIGAQLPTERFLCEKLEVSRSSIREALRVLEVLGFVELRSGEGTFVCDPLTNTILSRFYVNYSDLDWYLELIEAREIIEQQIISLTVERVEQEDLDNLKHTLEEMKKKIQKGERPIEENSKFHRIIWSAARNRFLFDVVSKLFVLIFEKESLLNEQVEVSENFIKDHQLIYEAISAKNGKKAKQAINYHHKSIEETILRAYKERGNKYEN